MTTDITEAHPVGTVHQLRPPAVPPADTTPLNLVKQPTAAPQPVEQPKPRRTRSALRAARVAVTHQRTRDAGRLAVRHGMYVLGGTRIVARRAWDGRTVAVHQRMLAAAVAAGDVEAVAEWQDKADRFRQARHARRMQLITGVPAMARAVVTGAAVTEGVLLAAGIAMALSDGGQVADVIAPTMGAVEFISTVATVVAVVWGPLVAVAPWLLLSGLWAVGARQHAAPQWAMPAGHRSDDGAPITPSVVVTALRDLGIAPLRKAIKDMGDVGAGMLSPIVIAGCGVEVDVTLPSGVSTDQIQDRRKRLAENLNRHEHELFITIPPAARTVRLWIADSGALDEPIGPSPLVLDETATANYKTGRAPWGQDLRGDAAMPSLYQRHLLCTGASNQGKTASLRALALWLALDPTVEFRIGDLKGDDDWDMFDGLATVYVKGPTDEHVAAVTEMVEAGVAEMERRLMAPKGTAFPPLVILVDEAQQAFMCPAVGDDKRPYGGVKATSRYFNAARKIHNQGRAVSVTLWQGTQDPTDQNLPKIVREGAHIRASLVLGTEAQAKMALGDKAIDGGAAPHKLRMGRDKGTLVVAGDHGIPMDAGQSSITVRTHFIDDDDAKVIAQRAKDRRAGVTTATAIATDEPVDHLADILAVLGSDERVRTDEVRQRLAQMNPDEYRGFTAQDLTRVLTDAGAAPYKSGGVIVVARNRVAEAIADRAEDDSA